MLAADISLLIKAGLIFLIVIVVCATTSLLLRRAMVLKKEKRQREQYKVKFETAQGMLRPLIKDATEITLVEPSAAIEESNLKSNFGGLPYFEKGEAWPQSKDGTKLEFVFQIFAEDGFAMPQKIKLVQFFYDFEEMPWDTDEDGWCVKIYETLDKENVCYLEKPENLNSVTYCELKFSSAKSLPNWREIDGICPEVSELLQTLAENRISAYETLTSSLLGEQDAAGSSHLGGYAEWWQHANRPKDEEYQLLFKIVSEDKAELMWGDCGSIYLYYHPRTKATEFTVQCT